MRRLLVWGWSLLVVLAAAVPAAIDPPDRAYPPIHSDGVGYHAWTRAIVKREFGFCHYTPLHPVGALSAVHPRNPKRCTNQFSPGLALLRLPVMAWFVQEANPDLVISDEEHEANLWMGVVALAIACGFLLAGCRSLGVRPLVANLVALATVFGTGLYHYATFDGSFTHVYSAALFAILVWLGLRAGRAGRDPPAVAVAALAAVIVAVRQPNAAVLLVLLAGWLAWRMRELPAAQRGRQVVRSAAPTVVGMACALAAQAIYVKWSSGHWGLSAYVDESFDLSYLKERPVLLSYERGLFTWYPAAGVLLAAALASRRARPLGLVAAGVVAALAVVYGSWHSWPLGAGFGHRGFVDVAPLLGVAGAYGLDTLRVRVLAPALAALAVCAFATVSLMAGYWRGTIPIVHTSPDQYWSHLTGRDALWRRP
ncbi:MAG TPA: hypothetical protein VNB64_08310 [Solirubrobacteraceae bacterium]|nr:hypothetical protein [Solirubrobacteraceae bacterium]